MILTKIAIVAIVALFATVAYSGPVQPVKSTDGDWLKDPNLIRIRNQFVEVVHQAGAIDKVFESSLAFPNDAELREQLQKIPHLRAEARRVVSELDTEIAQTQIQSFYLRLFIESLRLQAGRYDQLLKAIGLRILGHLSGDFEFDNYVSSETISVAKQLLLHRFDAMMASCAQVDRLLPVFEKVNLETKKQIERQLQFVIGNATIVKGEIGGVFNQEMEKIRLEGKELNLNQKMNFEMTIDLLNYTRDFVIKFKDLLGKSMFSFLLIIAQEQLKTLLGLGYESKALI